MSIGRRNLELMLYHTQCSCPRRIKFTVIITIIILMG